MRLTLRRDSHPAAQAEVTSRRECRRQIEKIHKLTLKTSDSDSPKLIEDYPPSEIFMENGDTGEVFGESCSSASGQAAGVNAQSPGFTPDASEP